jgi:ribosomal-protein-alanine N-acetyltransferase
VAAMPVPPSLELVPLALADLGKIAAGERVEPGGRVALEGALLPGHVATLALADVGKGTPEHWCVPWLVVMLPDRVIVGSCRFKSAPVAGEVEISYGIAPALRGRGLGTQAIRELLAIASAEPTLRRVIANVLPANAASMRLVRRLGFVAERTFTDQHGDEVMRWVWSRP